MWNVLGYCKDFVDNKVDFNEFKRILKDQRPLYSFIKDSYEEIITSKYKQDYINENGIIYPNKEHKDIIEFILNSNDLSLIKQQLKLLIDFGYKLNS